MQSTMGSGLPWWQAEQCLQLFHNKIAMLQEEISRVSPPKDKKLELHGYVGTVMVSCDADRMPTHVLTTQEAFEHLKAVYDKLVYYSEMGLGLPQGMLRHLSGYAHPWPWYHPAIRTKSAIKKACLAQMTQHLKALVFLCVYNKSTPLDCTFLRRVHHILMAGYMVTPLGQQDTSNFRNFRVFMDSPMRQVDATRQEVSSQFRNVRMHSPTGAACVHESAIESSVKDMLTRLLKDDDVDVGTSDYNFSDYVHTRCTSYDFPDRCAILMKDMMHIQPWSVGNRWMYGLLVSFFLVSHDMFAFPVPIAAINPCTYEEDVFQFLLVSEDDRGMRSSVGSEKVVLSAYILECVCKSLAELMASDLWS